MALAFLKHSLEDSNVQPGLRMPAVGSGESWKLFKQRYDLTNVCLRSLRADWRLMDGWPDGLVDGGTDEWVDKQMDECRVNECGDRHGAGGRRTSQEVTLIQEKRDDEGLGSDSSPGLQIISETSWRLRGVGGGGKG